MGNTISLIFSLPARFMVMAMQWLNSNVLHNYAITIVFFTLLLKLATLPFDIKQRRSMRKTTKIQPQLAALQKRYKDQPQVLQKKTSQLYKENNASPTAGCLPMLITFLFFTVFLSAMTIWSNYENIILFENAYSKYVEADMDTNSIDIERGSSDDLIAGYKFGPINNIWMPDTMSSPVIMKYENFAKINFKNLESFFSEETIKRSSDITEKEYDDIMRPYAKAYDDVYNGWFIFPVLTTLAFFVSQLLTQKTNPQPPNPDNPGASMGNSKFMALAMSALSGSFTLRNSAAFGIYWLASSVIGIVVTLVLYYIGKSKDEKALQITSS